MFRKGLTLVEKLQSGDVDAVLAVLQDKDAVEQLADQTVVGLMFYAVRRGYIDVLKLLALQYPTKLYFKIELKEAHSFTTLLHEAVEAGQLKAVEFLLKNRVQQRADDKGNYPVHIIAPDRLLTAANDDVAVEMLKLLLNADRTMLFTPDGKKQTIKELVAPESKMAAVINEYLTPPVLPPKPALPAHPSKRCFFKAASSKEIKPASKLAGEEELTHKKIPSRMQVKKAARGDVVHSMLDEHGMFEARRKHDLTKSTTTMEAGAKDLFEMAKAIREKVEADKAAKSAVKPRK